VLQKVFETQNPWAVAGIACTFNKTTRSPTTLAPRRRRAEISMVAGTLIGLLLASIRPPQSISYGRGHWYVHAHSIPRILEFAHASPSVRLSPVCTRHKPRPFCATMPSLGTESIKIGYDRDRSTRGDVFSARAALRNGVGFPLARWTYGHRSAT